MESRVTITQGADLSGRLGKGEEFGIRQTPRVSFSALFSISGQLAGDMRARRTPLKSLSIQRALSHEVDELNACIRDGWVLNNVVLACIRYQAAVIQIEQDVFY